MNLQTEFRYHVAVRVPTKEAFAVHVHPNGAAHHPHFVVESCPFANGFLTRKHISFESAQRRAEGTPEGPPNFAFANGATLALSLTQFSSCLTDLTFLILLQRRLFFDSVISFLRKTQLRFQARGSTGPWKTGLILLKRHFCYKLPHDQRDDADKRAQNVGTGCLQAVPDTRSS